MQRAFAVGARQKATVWALSILPGNGFGVDEGASCLFLGTDGTMAVSAILTAPFFRLLKVSVQDVLVQSMPNFRA